MSNPNKDLETEELIKKTAKNLFFKEGKFGATTQEIADAAGVNRTLINYYFRSRENLMQLVFEDAKKREEDLRENALFSELPFKSKIEIYIQESLKNSLEYPYLETYIVSQLNKGVFYHKEKDYSRFFEQFYKDFNAEVAKGNIENIDPVQFIFNVASLVSFPMAIRPLFQSIMNLSDERYEELIRDRKEIIMNILFKN
ncbi:MAG: TetR/AcrR family transcriptional regulator [Weeksellaceae bacterium]